jgi:SET domain-containing protein
MMTVRCYLAPSSIEGLGVFCRDPIARGDVVWRTDPVLDMRIPAATVSGFPPHVQEFIDRYAYPDMRDKSLLVLESDEGRFMNHSPTPNLDFRSFEAGFALVDIPAGVELTCDYREFEDNLVMQPPRHRVHPQPDGKAA